MPIFQDDFSSSALETAMEDNLFAFFENLKHWPRLEVHNDNEILWTISDIDFPMFNSILRARIKKGHVNEIIEQRKALCIQRNVPMLWWTGPTSQPQELEEMLIAQGFKHAGDNPGMAVDLLSIDEGPSLPASLTFVRVNDKKSALLHGEVLAESFDFPDYVGEAFDDMYSTIGFEEDAPLQNYLGFWEGKPVSCASVYYGAGVAGIYNVGTIPEGRRKGIGKQITLLSLQEARELGYRIGILHASDMGVNVYKSIGFQEYCKISHYVWDGTGKN